MRDYDYSNPRWAALDDRSNNLIATCLASFPTAPPIQWLWENVLPTGHLTLLAGPPSRAKSFLALDIAARVSRGSHMPTFPPDDPLATYRVPDSAPPPPRRPEPRPVLLFSSEDSLHSTILPRLRSLNADLSNIHIVDGEERPVSLADDAVQLRDFIANFHRRPPPLIIIDTLPALLGSVHPLRVRRSLHQLACIAEHCRAAVLAITHTSPRSSSRTPPRLVGSFYYTSAARLIWHCDFAPPDPAAHLRQPAPHNPHAPHDPHDPNDEGPLFALSLLKSNLPLRDTAYSFSISRGRLLWRAAAPAAHSLLRPPALVRDAIREAEQRHQRFRVEDAMTFLQAELAAGPRKTRDLLAAARAAAISTATLRRAKFHLALRSSRIGSEWFWHLPAQSPPDPPADPPTAPPPSPPDSHVADTPTSDAPTSHAPIADTPAVDAPAAPQPSEIPQGAHIERAKMKICAPCIAHAPSPSLQLATSAPCHAPRPRPPPLSPAPR